MPVSMRPRDHHQEEPRRIDGQTPAVFLWSVAINLAAWLLLAALIEGRLF